jgi:GH24 family phage-related lysozyme (muramidase)
MKLSAKGSQVLMDREGCELTAYQDSVGVWTIGVGHTSAAGEPKVSKGMVISTDQASDIFALDVRQFEDVVNGAVAQPMEQHQYDAFVSICFNIGGSGFREATFVKSFNMGAGIAKVTEEILWWNKPREIIPRRQAEAVQFRDGKYVARIDPMV